MKTILSTFLILAVLAMALSTATADISSAGMLDGDSAFFVTEDANEPHPEAILVGEQITDLSDDSDPNDDDAGGPE